MEICKERIQSLRSRSSQLAGFAAAVVALVGGNADRILATLRWASLLFLLGLLAVAVALGIFIVEVTFNV